MKKIFVLIFLSGCMVGPNYQTPKSELSKEFVETTTDTITSLQSWWKIFEDKALDDLIATAIDNNYDLKIALEKIEGTRAFYRIKKTELFPEIDLTASAIRSGLSQNLIQNSFFPFLTLNNFQVGFDAVWEIDLFGKLRREKEAAFYMLQSMQENMRDVYVTLICDVARYYIDLCAVQNLLDLTNKKIQMQKTILELVQDKTRIGLDSQIDEKQELANLCKEKENLFFYSTLYKQTLYQITYLLGKQPEEISKYIPSEKLLPNAENKVFGYLPSLLLRTRPDIRKAERQLAQATAKIGSAIADYFPSFSLTGSNNFEANKVKSWFQSNSFAWSLGSIMNWPIITFGRIKANVDMKKSEEKQAFLFYKNTILQALKDVEGALATYYYEQEKFSEIHQEYLAIKIKTDLEKDKYVNGLNSLIFYLEQEKILIDNQIKEIESQRSLCHDLIAVYKSFGGGDWGE